MDLDYAKVPGQVPSDGPKPGRGDGEMRISREVIQQIANQALLGVIGVRPAESQGTDKQKVVSVEVREGPVPVISVDVSIKTRLGLSIPDIAWYVQESIRKNLEQNTGYSVEEINVFVKGLYRE